MADATVLTVDELTQLKLVQLKELCRDLSLPTYGTKFQLVTRISSHLQGPESEGRHPTSTVQAQPAKNNLNQSISALEARISELETKIQISQLEHEISALYKKHVSVQSTPKVARSSSSRLPKQGISTISSSVIQTNQPLPSSPPFQANPNHSSISTAQQNQSGHVPHSSELSHAFNNSMLAYQMQASKLPTCEPPVFHGDILKFNDWNKAFTRFIDTNPTLTAGEKLSYLARYTGEEVATLVEGYLSLDDDGEAYEMVRNIIKQRYGHPQKIANSFLSRLHSWPKIPANDNLALQRFSDFLINCQTAMKSVPNLSFLDHPHENNKLKQLLPPWLKRKWNETAIRFSKENGETFPPFAFFVRFIHEQSELLNHPIACDDATVHSSSLPPSKRVHVHKAAASANSPMSTPPIPAKPKSLVTPATPANVTACNMCRGPHRLYKCERFKSLDPPARLVFVRKQNLCVVCLNASHGEGACTLSLYCGLCKQHGAGHNQLLHDALACTMDTGSTGNQDNLASPQTASETSLTTLSCHVTQSSTSYIVPVYVSHRSKPDIEMLTYAMIDSQSQITFITDSLAQSLTSPLGKSNLSLSTMTSKNDVSARHVYEGLSVRGYNQSQSYDLNMLYGCESIPNNLQAANRFDLEQWPSLSTVVDQFPPVFECEVGLLIGHDHHFASYPVRAVPNKLPSNVNEPFALCTPLGWTMVGPIAPASNPRNSRGDDCSSHCIMLSLKVPDALQLKTDSNRPQVYQVVAQKPELSQTCKLKSAVPMDVVKRLEFGCELPGDNSHSISSLDDEEFVSILSQHIRIDSNGLYSMPLPFRGGQPPRFPNNRTQALTRLKGLNHKFSKPGVFEQYNKFMSDLLTGGDAEPVLLFDLNASNKWYLPHHNVSNPKKPNKFRVVFDASCTYQNSSLNSHLLSGPDLNNSLIGVLTRFRERKIAIACDIEKMFYRFSVFPEHRNFLRFLWYNDQHQVAEYRMTKHIFGATSSPGCAKFGLLQVAKDYCTDDNLVRWFLERCFYVDDGLYSCDSVSEAISLLSRTKSVCEHANLRIHKLMSNSPQVLMAFPPADIGCNLKQFTGGEAEAERTLGINWDPVLDMFTFPWASPDMVVATRRSMLRFIASLFDPLGFLSPVTLVGRSILQRACHGLDWDEPLPDSLSGQWTMWLDQLLHINEVKVPRCLNLASSATIKSELHTFSDASEKGYGACCYIRMFSENGSVHTVLLFGKSRVVPLKGCTMPRLELQAAVLAAKISSQLSQELSIEIEDQYLWSDSEIVLAYIQNTRKKLKQYVRNRIVIIHELTKVCNWHYVASTCNPADIASRGCSSIDQLINSDWFNGPKFLNEPSFTMLGLQPLDSQLPAVDPEIHNEEVSLACQKVDIDDVLLETASNVSSYVRAVRTIDLLLHTKKSRWKTPYISSVQSRQEAEYALMRSIQAIHFHSELLLLSQSQRVTPKSSIYRLDPFIDEHGVIRVGGRLQYAQLLEYERHPIIVPKGTHVAHLLIKHFHEKCAHQGRGMTASYIRSAGFWIINLNSAVSSFIHSCVDCRKLRRPTEQQKMAVLPTPRVNPSPPFTYVGIDCFGPFEAKDRRRTIKLYGIIFTCLYSRAVHVEVCDDLSTDSFLICLRAFLSLRGAVCEIYCDNGTNFVGAANELTRALQTMNDGTLKQVLDENNCKFVFNSPFSSHMGGVWERMIRTFRSVLNGLLLRGPPLDKSSIRTVFYECMNIINSRPLTVVDADGLAPLTPNHLLHMKTSLVVPPPPGDFSDDSYSHKRWKRVQAVVDAFWHRWKGHYLASLQPRKLWTERKTFDVGDVVLLKDDSVCRAHWKLALIVKLISSHDGLVRRVQLKVGDSSTGLKTNKPVYLERPVHRLVLLVKAANVNP